MPDGKRLDISPLHQALGNAYLSLARGRLSQPGGPDGPEKKKHTLIKALNYFELAERVPWGFAPADARLQQNLAEAREQLARIFQEETSSAPTPEARDALVRERDQLRDAAFGALDKAHRLLRDGGVSPNDADFRAVLLERGTSLFNREFGATPDEQAMWFRKALDAYREAASVLPDDPRSVFYAGLCYERLWRLASSPEEKRRNFASAEAAYRKALTLHTVSPEYHPLLPYRALASLYSSSGDSRSALEFLKRVRERDPGYSQSAGVDREIQALEQSLPR